MHILILSDNFPPEVNAPASRTFEHAREWVRAGHLVTVITGAPNFPQGRVHPGYRNRWFQAETIEGVPMRAIRLVAVRFNCSPHGPGRRPGRAKSFRRPPFAPPGLRISWRH